MSEIAKARLPWILLGLSLALNIFFIGGVFWTRAKVQQAILNQPVPPVAATGSTGTSPTGTSPAGTGPAASAATSATPAERIEGLARQLSLDTGQRRAFERFLRTARERTRTLREGNQPLFEDVWREIEKATPDEAAISRVFDTASTHRRAYQTEMSKAMIGFLAVLSPEQRKSFIEMLRNRQAGGNVPPVLRQLMP